MQIENLVGRTITAITRFEDSALLFWFENEDPVLMYHQDDCCETVNLEEVIGDLNDLIHHPVLVAEERTNHVVNTEDYEEHFYTFYEFSTFKGNVTLRWVGSSNGYYSMSVDLVELDWKTASLLNKYFTDNKATLIE